MIRVEVVRQSGILRGIRSRGHAVTVQGTESAPCAVVSVLLQSFGLAVVEREGCAVRGDVNRPGEFYLFCERCDDEAWYLGVSEIVLRTIDVIRTAWPDDVEVTYTDEE